MGCTGNLKCLSDLWLSPQAKGRSPCSAQPGGCAALLHDSEPHIARGSAASPDSNWQERGCPIPCAMSAFLASSLPLPAILSCPSQTASVVMEISASEGLPPVKERQFHRGNVRLVVDPSESEDSQTCTILELVTCVDLFVWCSKLSLCDAFRWRI